MARNFRRWFPGIPFAMALLLAQGVAMAGDRMMVQHSKQPTGAEGGLGYEYTFKVTKHGSGEPVDGADFSVSTDMPSMPGAHHMPHVTGEPAGEPGTYRAALDFDMPGAWTLILRFRTPNPDQVVISDMIEMQPGGKAQAGHGDSSGGMDHSGHDMKKE